MPQINIPGVGMVEFPYDMSDEDINAAAAKLYQDANRKPASAEDFAPAPRTNQLPTDPSTGGFLSNLASGAAEAVQSIPRTIKGLSRINPLGNFGSAAMAASEMPTAMIQGVTKRVGDYAENPSQTIYDDPLSFLGDVSAVAGPAVGAARGSAAMASRAARSIPAAAGTLADLGIDAAVGAVKGKLPGGGGSAVRGAIKEAAQGYARRSASRTTPPLAELDRYMPNTSAPRATEFGPSAMQFDDPLKVDRYMPNTSAPKSGEFGPPAMQFDDPLAALDRYMPNIGAEKPPPLWNDITPDMPAPQRPLTRVDDAATRYIRANGGQAELLRELLEAEGMGGFRRLRRPIQ